MLKDKTMTQTSDTVSIEILDGIGLIRLDNPPVNACGFSLRLGISEALKQLEPQVDAIGIYGAGRCFIAGADITEFGKPIREPIMPQVCLDLENCTKPVVAVMHGATLGGGLEIALATHARVALPSLITGFPEVTLGVLPGSGGTQRGPRLAGIRNTLDLATSGRRIGADEAQKMGLVDRIANEEPRAAALQAARDALAGTLVTRQTAQITVAADQAALDEYAAKMRKTQGHMFAPHKIVELIALSTDDFTKGMAAERQGFFDCVDSPQRAGLIHAFFAERAVAKIPEAGATPTTQASDFCVCDVIIEAVFEDMSVKKQVFKEIDLHAKPGAILASNTSYLDINEIAAATSRPDSFIGLHFFSPAHVMRLLEVVVGEHTAPEVVATGFALAKKLRKIAVRSEVCDGFIGNRLLNHYRKVADYLVMDGATPAQVDKAIKDFGFAMGPFTVLDMAGLEIGWAGRKRRAPTRPAEERYIEIADRICEAGWFGRKTGQGYYVYGDEVIENPDVLKIIEAERTKAGVTPRSFTDAEIVDRYMTAMVTEAARIVEDGTALRPVDVDAVKLFGYGFPRHHGGPLQYADQIGAKTLIERIETYATEDAYYWQVPNLMRQMAEDGRTFADLNQS